MKRFWAKVDKTKSCWLWCASTRGNGRYGNFYFDGKNQQAHRIAYQIKHGTIPEGMHVLHRCDNTLCVNPEHLFLGSHKDNMLDRNLKGRAKGGSLPGDLNPNIKLTREIVLEIRQRHNNGETQAALSRIFKVSDMTIHKIVTRKTWKNI